MNIISKKRKYLIVVSHDTQETVKTFDITDKSDKYIERLDDGLNMTLNHKKYYTTIQS